MNFDLLRGDTIGLCDVQLKAGRSFHIRKVGSVYSIRMQQADGTDYSENRFTPGSARGWLCISNDLDQSLLAPVIIAINFCEIYTLLIIYHQLGQSYLGFPSLNYWTVYTSIAHQYWLRIETSDSLWEQTMEIYYHRTPNED